MYRIDIGLDAGSSNVSIFMRDKGIVINQPAVLAYEKKTGKIIAVGNKARKMTGKTGEDIVVAQPIRHGVISEYALAERMIKAFIKNALRKRKIWGRPNLCVVVPMGISEVERRAVEDAVVKVGAREIFLLESPVAAALGENLDIMEMKGHMIVNIGGGTTDIAIVSSGDISTGVMLKTGGEDFDDALARYIRRNYNVELGKISAEQAKIRVGAVYPRENDVTREIRGKNLMNGLPARIRISANETVEAFSDILTRILDGITGVLEDADPELAADVAKEGIRLSGGGSRIYGMDKWISEKTGIPVLLSEEPEAVTAIGAGLAGEYITLQDTETEGIPEDRASEK